VIDVGTGVSFGVLAFAGAAFAWLWRRFDAIIAAERVKSEAVAADLFAFRLEATRTYATAAAIEKSEARLSIAIEKMTARLETVIGRIEALSNDLVRVAAGRVERFPRKAGAREAGD
jgi:hypothetical protein